MTDVSRTQNSDITHAEEKLIALIAAIFINQIISEKKSQNSPTQQGAIA